MKTKVLLIMILIGAQLLNAQGVVGSYNLSFFDKDFVVKTSSLKGKKYSIFFEVKGEQSSDVSINIDNKDLNKFKKSLINIRDKYQEWSNTATENNVTSMNKLMDIKMPLVSTMWHTPSKIYFSVRNDLNPVFSVQENGNHVVIIAKKVASSMNRYISETFYWVFSSTSEIDELLSLLDENKLKETAKGVSELNNLFN